ncbi:hypothetical protein [Treponema sp.]|uniref:hypothetical protein n=1 Tax=Treponema sp. TaxID=166 RepID=UPI003F00AC7D
MYILQNNNVTKIEQTSFKELGLIEKDVEEILRKNIEMLCDEEDSMLIIGQQVTNEEDGRSDLTAIDDDGNLVLVEIKRDKKDIEHRKEAFEFQAIRYAASLATIHTKVDLVQDIYSPYVEKHKEEYKDCNTHTSTEIALKELEMFLDANNIDSNRLNKKQRIILVASEFDAQTLSAVAWLNTNNVDISCYQICLNRTEDKIFIDMKKLLPVDDYNDYFVNISKKTNNTFRKQRNGAITRRQLPKIDTMLEWGIVKPNDKIIAKNTNEECILLESGLIRTKDNEEMSLQQWLKNITGWSSVETYVFSIHAATGKSLSELRAEYMENNEDK